VTVRGSTSLSYSPERAFYWKRKMKHISYHLRRVIDLHSFLDRFDSVRGGSPNSQGIIQYTAKCPAHETSHNSLAIGATRDGRYLVHCHAGCAASDVLAAVGLTLQDIYPDGGIFERAKAINPAFPQRVDKNVLEIAQADRISGKRLSEADKRREKEAFIRSKREKRWPQESAT